MLWINHLFGRLGRGRELPVSQETSSIDGHAAPIKGFLKAAHVGQNPGQTIPETGEKG
jgi:hypothetical protein